MRTEMIIEGGERLNKQLNWLAKNVQAKIVRGAVRKALTPVKKTAKQYAVQLVGGDMGNLMAQNLILKPFKKKRPGRFGMHMMLRPGVDEFVYIAERSRHPGGRTYIPAAIEYGHVLSGWALWQTGAPAGAGQRVEGIPFIKLASDDQLPKAPFIMAAELKKNVEKVKDIGGVSKSLAQKKFHSAIKRAYRAKVG
jgi:hypothetical protein